MFISQLPLDGFNRNVSCARRPDISVSYALVRTHLHLNLETRRQTKLIPIVDDFWPLWAPIDQFLSPSSANLTTSVRFRRAGAALSVRPEQKFDRSVGYWTADMCRLLGRQTKVRCCCSRWFIGQEKRWTPSNKIRHSRQNSSLWTLW